MSYLQRQTNNYFGFMPIGRNPRVGTYHVASSEGNAISIGDWVTLSTTLATARVITGAFTGVTLGVAASPLAANAGSTSALLNSDSSQLLKVYDDPYQVFVTCDTTSGLIGSTGMFKQYAILATGAVGDTGPIGNQSRMAISGVTGSSAGAVKVVGMHPIDREFSTDAGGAGVAASVRKYLVLPASHYYGSGSTNATAVTT